MDSKNLPNLVSDINKLFEGKDFEERIEHFSDKMGLMLASRFKSYGEESEPTLRMSNLGKPLRQLYYELTGAPKEELPAKAKFKFLYGDILEILFLFLAKEAGYSVHSEQKELMVDGVPGHIDAYIEDVLVDTKSCSPYSFKKFETGSILTDDPFGYITQLGTYASVDKAEKASFIGIEKVTGEICIYDLPSEKLRFDAPSRIAEVRETVARGIEPPRCYAAIPVSKTDKTGNLCLSVPCSWCSRKQHCWRDSNDGAGLQVRYYSTGPKYFTSLVKEPRLKSSSDNNSFEEFPTK